MVRDQGEGALVLRGPRLGGPVSPTRSLLKSGPGWRLLSSSLRMLIIGERTGAASKGWASSGTPKKTETSDLSS